MSKNNDNTNESKTEVKVTPEQSAKDMAALRAKKKQERVKAIRDRDVLGLSAEMVDKLAKQGKVAKLAKRELIPFWKTRGYEILENPEHESSDSTYNGKSASGGFEVQDSKSDPTSKSVWMVTDIENREILREIEEDQALVKDSYVGKSKISVNGESEDLLSGTLKKA